MRPAPGAFPGHHRRVAVHHVSHYGVRRRRQEPLDWGEAHQAPVRAHGHDDSAVEGASAHLVPHRPNTLLGLGHGHVANRVSGGGTDPLVQLLCQTGVRSRVWRYLMSSHSVFPSHAVAMAIEQRRVIVGWRRVRIGWTKISSQKKCPRYPSPLNSRADSPGSTCARRVPDLICDP